MRRHGLFDDFVGIAAKLPWWAGIALVIVSYFALNHFANTEIPHSTGLKEVGDAAVAQIWKTLATIGQYVLPAAFVIGSLVSVTGTKRKNGK
ncbi:MAG TPA: hypothetical protein VMT94_01130 [Burkholderiales bacterium]|nr:hypothetical protein [Burkholderiales bacterium]